MHPEQRLAVLGIELPKVPTPIAFYIPAVEYSNMIITSGQLPFENGVLASMGRVGKERHS